MSPVTIPVPSEFKRFCQRAHLAPKQVLTAFMSDLARPTRLTVFDPIAVVGEYLNRLDPAFDAEFCAVVREWWPELAE